MHLPDERLWRPVIWQIRSCIFLRIGLKDRGIGIAVKLEDGCSEFMPGVVMKVLTDLGVISAGAGKAWRMLGTEHL